jgi:hypothetical protein
LIQDEDKLDVSDEDEEKLRADSLAMSNYILKGLGRRG